MEMNRGMRSMDRAMRYMASVDGSPDMSEMNTAYMKVRRAHESGDDVQMESALLTLGEHVSSMRESLDGMDGLSEMDDMDMGRAMKGMERAMSTMKGNAPSHDYSRTDGEFTKIGMGDDAYMADTDDMDEDVQELRARLHETQEMLKRVTAAYILSKHIPKVEDAQHATFLESVQRFDEFATLGEFEEHVLESIQEHLGESAPTAPQQPLHENTQLGAPMNPDSPIYQNIQFLAGITNH